MRGFEAQLRECLCGRVCFVGIGEVDAGDDACGVHLAERLLKEFAASGIHACRTGLPAQPNWGELRDLGRIERPASGRQRPASTSGKTPDVTPSILVAGTEPERLVGRLADADFDHVVFLDAVEMGGAPGAVALLTAEEMGSRYPQVSTHKFSLGLLAKLIAANGRTRVWLLGVQPGSVRPGATASSAVVETVDLLAGLITSFASVRSGLRTGTMARTIHCS